MLPQNCEICSDNIATGTSPPVSASNATMGRGDQKQFKLVQWCLKIGSLKIAGTNWMNILIVTLNIKFATASNAKNTLVASLSTYIFAFS